MDTLIDQIRGLSSSDWVYAIIFVLAVARAMAVTSYVVSGTVGFIVVGGLVAHGFLHPLWSILAAYLGTLTGDVVSFMLSRVLQRVRFIARAVCRLQPLRGQL